MTDDLDALRRRYESTVEMLETLESALEPLVEDSMVLSDLDLEARYTSNVRKFARGLAGAEPTERQREAFEELFGTAIDELSGPTFGTTPDPEAARNNLVDTLDWVAGLEEQLGGSEGAGAAFEGLTAGLGETLLRIGEAFAERVDDEPRPARELERLRDSMEELLARPNVDDHLGLPD